MDQINDEQDLEVALRFDKEKVLVCLLLPHHSARGGISSLTMVCSF